MDLKTQIKLKKTNEMKTKKTREKEYYCPLCNEKYGETAEEWIQCTTCNSWWHEACTDYESGVFNCDLCEDID